jgi:hypothetical protein
MPAKMKTIRFTDNELDILNYHYKKELTSAIEYAATLRQLISKLQKTQAVKITPSGEGKSSNGPILQIKKKKRGRSAKKQVENLSGDRRDQVKERRNPSKGKKRRGRKIFLKPWSKPLPKVDVESELEISKETIALALAYNPKKKSKEKSHKGTI